MEKGVLFRIIVASKLWVFHDKKGHFDDKTGHFHDEKGHFTKKPATFRIKRDILLRKTGHFSEKMGEHDGCC